MHYNNGRSTDAYHTSDGPPEKEALTMLRREEIQVVSKVLYIRDRSGNTEPNMLLRTQLVLHSEGILNLPLWGSVCFPYSPLFNASLSIVLIYVLFSSLHHCLPFFPFPLIQHDLPFASHPRERCIARRHCWEIDQSLFFTFSLACLDTLWQNNLRGSSKNYKS